LLGHALDREIGVLVALDDEAPGAAGQLVDAEAAVRTAHRRGLALADEEQARALVELVAHDARAGHAASVGIDHDAREDRAARELDRIQLDAAGRDRHAALLVGREAARVDPELHRARLHVLEAEPPLGVGLRALALEPREVARQLEIHGKPVLAATVTRAFGTAAPKRSTTCPLTAAAAPLAARASGFSLEPSAATRAGATAGAAPGTAAAGWTSSAAGRSAGDCALAAGAWPGAARRSPPVSQKNAPPARSAARRSKGSVSRLPMVGEGRGAFRVGKEVGRPGRGGH
jgi:hypothetical protein